MIINDFIALLKEYKVVIPPIQRDYAQGRINDDVKRIRDRFLKKITSVLVDDYMGKPLKLDFIYGYTIVDETGNGTKLSLFLPLDGQQRLTTLFLIYWYVAISEGKMDEGCQTVLSNFSYSTRAKSRKFCEKLVEFIPSDDNNTIASQIQNQPWFFISWASDPTISSMLVMLDAIQKEFSANNLNGIWEKLSGPNPRIIFYLLKMEDLGLPEDLYIKMNSRGKPLTEFEYFKSQFSGLIPPDLLPQFKTKIDSDWSDLFWNMHRDSKVKDVAREVDSSFLNFYNYITDILISTKDIPIAGTYWLDVAASVYKKNTENVEFLFKCLDLFVEQEKSKPDYFNSLFYIKKGVYTSETVRLFFSNPQTNLFYKCAKSYDSNKRPNPFSIGEQLLLFASILNLSGIVTSPSEKIRKLRNLIASSEDQMRKEYLSSLYKEVQNIFEDKPISDNAKFSKHQVSEEDFKMKFLSENRNLIDTIYILEDHDLLRGSISILNLDDSIVRYAPIFNKIFSEYGTDYLSISRAMMSIGNYSQDYGGKRRRMGNHNTSTWRELLTTSDRRRGFNNTKSILTQYLQHFIDYPEISNKQIIENNYTTYYPWHYYYARYQSFQLWESNPTEGYYYWEDFDHKPYECYMMYRKQFNGRHWNPFLLELSLQHTNSILENYGNDLQIVYNQVILKMKMNNEEFVFSVSDGDDHSMSVLKELCRIGVLNEESKLVIQQNDKGYDLEDRINSCLTLLQKIDEFMLDRTNK